MAKCHFFSLIRQKGKMPGMPFSPTSRTTQVPHHFVYPKNTTSHFQASDMTTLNFKIPPSTTKLPQSAPSFTGHGSSFYSTPMIADRHSNAFVGMAVTAWREHLPLELDAGIFWILLLKAIALHVQQDSAKVRHKFVNFEGKQEIIVRADDFVRNSSTNDWPRMFESFVAQIDSKSKPGVVSSMEPKFSTTSELERLVGRIAIMDVCKSFFSYTMRTMCGFPSVTLLGTRDDWVGLDARIDGLMALCDDELAAKWGPALHSVTQKFVRAFDGETDEAFWQSMCKRGGREGSGGYSWYTGWVNVFLPFIKGSNPRNGFQFNRYCVPYSPDAGYVQEGLKEVFYDLFSDEPTWDRPPPDHTIGGPDVNFLPSAVCEAPVQWQYFHETFPLVFQAGIVGFQQTPSGALRAVVGWSVVDEAPASQSPAVDDDEF